MSTSIDLVDGIELIKKYQEGRTLGQLAKEYGVSAPTVSKRLRGLGVDVRSKGRRRKKKHTEYLPDPPSKPEFPGNVITPKNEHPKKHKIVKL
jgi:hypothetical protein